MTRNTHSDTRTHGMPHRAVHMRYTDRRSENTATMDQKDIDAIRAAVGTTLEPAGSG